nr:site-specific integrase [uncultured Carboxylicivirga sp.]
MRLITNFLLKKSKRRKDGKYPVYIRCTIDLKRIELSTGVYLNSCDWDNLAQKVAPLAENSRNLNKKLNNFSNTIFDKYYQLESLGNPYDINSLKECLTNTPQHFIVDTFQTILDDIHRRVGYDYSYGTYKHYKTIFGRLKEFIKVTYKKTDIPLSGINYKFIASFDSFLKIHHGVGPNTIGHYHKKLKKVLNDSIALGLINKNPYINFKVKRYQPNRDFLSLNEIKKVENKKIEIERIRTVRDIFIFACYTGLSYSDIYKLTKSHIFKGDDGEEWIIIDRTKTLSRCRIPLLPKAKAILYKYENYPKNENKGKLLPINSNQRMNTYLKEIADICEINKDLTMHIARHTFATTVTLANGVPIETVSKMLGHTSLKTTQIYGKIIDSKISKDMKKLKSMF